MTRIKRHHLVYTLLGAGVLLAPLSSALAGATRSFVLDSANVLSEGKLEGTAIESDGSIVRSVGVKRIELPGVSVARSLLVLPSGIAYVGTGNDGKIFAVKDGTATLFAETKELMVSSLASDGRGTLFAGTIAKGKIFAIDASGKLRELATPKGAEHIWSLAYDAAKSTLFAATGPEGKVFAIDASGKADVYYDSEATHVMTLALDPADAKDKNAPLYAGTSDQALVLRIRGAGRAEVVYDFDGNEITALDVKNGELAVGANLFPRAPASKPATPTPASDQASPQASTPTPPPPPAAAPGNRPQVGKGQLFRIDRSGQAERLFTADEGHITTVEWGESGVIYVGLGKEGRIHRVRADHGHALWVDVDERQVLAQELTGPHPMFVTADGAAIYEVLSGPAQSPTWTSKVLDAGVTARFGQLTFRGAGKLALQTRSGNTEKADDSWSAWSSPLTAAGPIRSPAARFLQVRALLDAQADSSVYAIEAFYLPANQTAIVTEVTVEPPARPKSDKPGRNTQSSSVYKIRWKTDNADGDALRFRIDYAQEKTGVWRPLLRETEVVTGSEQAWDTDGIPDGFYRVRVEASDELDNPTGTNLVHRAQSEPLLVDNHPPTLAELRADATRITGVARDNLGPISKLEYTVDGLEWKLLGAADDLFDTADERFVLPLSLVPKGDHVVVFRATDARGNSVASEIGVVVK